jgi:hypothetical protein
MVEIGTDYFYYVLLSKSFSSNMAFSSLMDYLKKKEQTFQNMCFNEPQKEVEKLCECVQFLEGEHHVKSDDVEDGSSVPVARNSSLHVTTDSTGFSSPFVYSPCSELSPDVPAYITHSHKGVACTCTIRVARL